MVITEHLNRLLSAIVIDCETFQGFEGIQDGIEYWEKIIGAPSEHPFYGGVFDKYDGGTLTYCESVMTPERFLTHKSNDEIKESYRCSIMNGRSSISSYHHVLWDDVFPGIEEDQVILSKEEKEYLLDKLHTAAEVIEL